VYKGNGDALVYLVRSYCGIKWPDHGAVVTSHSPTNTFDNNYTNCMTPSFYLISTNLLTQYFCFI